MGKRFCRVAILLSVMLVVGISCRKVDMTTVEIDVPQLENEACARLIRTALIKDQNVNPDHIEVDLVSRKVTVTYDTMKRALKNLEMTIADAGFQANQIPADKAARERLPTECLE